MGDDKGMGILLVVTAIIFFMGGLIFGYKAGMSDMCANQFQCEVHKDKCVKVQREEVK